MTIIGAMPKPRPKLECKECQYRWESRKKGALPKKCPNPHCQSPFWNGVSSYKARSANGSKGQIQANK